MQTGRSSKGELMLVKEKNRKKLNNNGFSLVELVTVIAIMVILTGLVTISASVLRGKNAQECRDKLMASLENVRTHTMGKKEVKAVLSKSGSEYILTVYTTQDANTVTPTVSTVMLGGSKSEIYYSFEEADTYSTSTSLKKVSDEELMIEFNRGSGALNSSMEGGTKCPYHIYVVQGDKVYGIRLYKETGKLVKE